MMTYFIYFFFVNRINHKLVKTEAIREAVQKDGEEAMMVVMMVAYRR